ncbi:MAG: hypothetical protein J6I64_08295, partial [Lachnospiraceae bacterium]|nr:hypothetical protein [Lachnospiraceae bacterium]
MTMRKTELINTESVKAEVIKALPSMKIDDLIQEAKTVAITGHLRPDGDCTGGCLGLRQYLLDVDPTRQVDVYLEPIPAAYDMLEGYDTVREYTEGEYDLCFVLDVADRDRLGQNA